tara:strand:+ start:348 stop:707 length:360 start_codon:yes stop_codon:yes gene_type:complete
MTFTDRIEQGEKDLCAWVALSEDEATQYHGAGVAFAVVRNAEIAELHYLEDRIEKEIKPLCEDLMAAQKGGAEIWQGVCSSYQFCEPEPLDMASTGAARVLRLFGEMTAFAAPSDIATM